MPIGDKKGGFIRPGYDPLEVPNEPADVAVSGGDTELAVSFTAPANTGGGAITGYQATTTTGASTTGASSPLTLTGLTNGVSYDVRVWALNAYGPGPFGTGSGSPTAPTAVFAGGGSNVIYYVTITTTGNATDFGDLSLSPTYCAGVSSSSRGIFSGFNQFSNVIEYITLVSPGNSTDFGDLQTASDRKASASNSTRGLFAGGINSGGSMTGTIEYVTIATTGNASGFGNLSITRYAAAGCQSPTRGVFGGGDDFNTFTQTRMDYVTIATTGNATNFGNLVVNGGTYGPAYVAACSSSTRGVFAGGVVSFTGDVNTMEYITIASTGNSTDFVDLLTTKTNMGGTSSETRGIFAGGSSNGSNVIQYITIASTGNSIDFGDMTVSRTTVGTGALSNAHGGLQ